MTTPIPATIPPYLSTHQLSFSPLKAKPIFTCSAYKQIHNKNTVQNSHPPLTQYRTKSAALHCEEHDSFLSNNWPELLKVSIGSRDFLLGQSIHAYLLKLGFQDDPFERNNLVNLYVKFHRLDLAHKVFDGMIVRNTITWTSLIKGNLDDDEFESALIIASDMHKAGEKLNEHACSVILQACSSSDVGTFGQQVHCLVIKRGFDENVFVGTPLIALYTRSGLFDDAQKVFDGMAGIDVRCFNFMISEYGRTGNGEKAIGVFRHLLNAGLEPNDYTFTNIISACDGNIGVEEGKQLQGLSFKYGFVNETSVGNAIITMYGRRGMSKEAERMFSVMSYRNLISWTALISSYTKNRDRNKVVDTFMELHGHGVNFDSSLLTTILDGCSECSNMELGLQIHVLVIKLGYACAVDVGTALVDLYAKCGNLISARIVFDGLPNKRIATFNAILEGFTENCRDDEDPLILFNRLRLDGVKPDMVTFSRLLSLSANYTSLGRGRSYHAYAIKTGFGADLTVDNAVITMYAKCGSIEDSQRMFHVMSDHDSVSWNAMISAYALHGQGSKALLLFEEMKKKDFALDEITILAILQACAYSGIFQDGISLFNVMEPKYGIKPLIEHYACMVDLLGRAGRLSEAMDMINSSPFSKSTLLWRTLVNVCKLCDDWNLGKIASKCLLDLSPTEAGSYMLVSNMYAGQKMLDEAASVRTTMNDLKLSKEAGSSWIEVDNIVHHFVASGKDHPESSEIYARLDLLRNDMRWNDEIADLNLIYSLV